MKKGNFKLIVNGGNGYEQFEVGHYFGLNKRYILI